APLAKPKTQVNVKAGASAQTLLEVMLSSTMLPVSTSVKVTFACEEPLFVTVTLKTALAAPNVIGEVTVCVTAKSDEAVIATVAAVVGARTMVTVALAPLARLPSEQVTVLLPPQVPCELTAETKVATGSGS